MFSFPMMRRILYLLLIFTPVSALAPGLCLGSEIIVRLSGKSDYPGDLSLLGKNIQLKKICFLGIDAKGKIDKEFLNSLSQKGIPEGDYRIAPPFPSEQWPAKSFKKNGALRLKIIAGPGWKFFESSGMSGVAIHGRDFYPLLDGIVKKKIMITFYNDMLFDRLRKHWGPLRISNWDMGRLADYWDKVTLTSKQWEVRLVTTNPEEIEKTCKPPATKRTPD